MPQARVSDVIAIMEKLAPSSLALQGDSIGLQVGHAAQPVEAILLCLDVTTAVLEEANQMKAGLIIAHHPLVFRPLSRILVTGYPERLLALALRREITVYAAHTNLDRAPGGVNDALADRVVRGLPVRSREPLCREEGTAGLGRLVKLNAPLAWERLLRIVEETLSPEFLRITGRPADELFVLALCGGSGNGLLETAMDQGADMLLTGELKYHEALRADTLGLTVIEAGHYHTEVPVLIPLARRLRDELRRTGFHLPVKVTSHSTSPYQRLITPN